MRCRPGRPNGLAACAHGLAAHVAVLCFAVVPLVVVPNLSTAADANGLQPTTALSMGLASATEGWVANGVSLFLTRDDGAHWNLLRLPGIEGDLATNLTGFASAGPQYLWFGGITGKGFGTCQHPTAPAGSSSVFAWGSVDRSTNGGHSWSEVRLPGCGVVTSLSFSSTKDGYALGPAATGTLAPYRGRLYRTVNGGRSWQLVSSVPFGGALVAPPSGSSTAFPSPSEGFAVSSYGTTAGWLYRTADGGKHWQKVALASPAGYSGPALFGTPQFFSANVGLVPALLKQKATGRGALVVFLTRDGGQHWAAVFAPPGNPSQGTVPFTAASPSHWFVYTGRWLYASDNTGASWTKLIPGPAAVAGAVHALQFASARDGWAIVGSSLEITTNGGRTWHQVGGGPFSPRSWGRAMSPGAQRCSARSCPDVAYLRLQRFHALGSPPSKKGAGRPSARRP
jgi:photosystem II stability/assembly factor-like uncharacterized protein